MNKTPNFDEILVKLRNNDPELTSVDLSGAKLTETQILSFIEVLVVNTNLTWLNLSWLLHMNHENIRQLAAALSVNKDLTYLRLTGNFIRHESVKYLAQALMANTGLTRLELAATSISDDGVKYLAQALITNTTLTYLGLRDNKIGDEGLGHIADMLKINQHLTELDLAWNENIGNKGKNLLKDALINNFVMTKLLID